MKRFIVFVLSLFCLSTVGAQTSLFLEDFDSNPISMTATSTASNPTWSLNTNYQTSGTSSDSAVVQVGDTLILESNSFSTMGFVFVTLNFSQICKVDFFDKAIVEYSINNGGNWTQLTSAEYLGAGILSNNSFSAISYSTAWDVSNGTTIPAASWWRNESFDLTAAANQTQVKVRFSLIDADNNGARNNYGWLLDDVEILGAPCELIPPTIALTGTVYQGSVFGTGPYLVQADIQDASGIASASIDYTVNGGSVNTLSMNFQSGTTYGATIPSASVGDVICYTINAVDNTTCNNPAQLPTAGCTQFIVNQNAPPNCVGSPVSNFNYSEPFASFTSGDGMGIIGTLDNDWANSTADTHDWWVYNQAVRSRGSNTGPSADHSLGDANYMYVESSNGLANETAILNTPCYNFSGLTSPKFSFWYHMFGANMGELHIDLYDGNAWMLDVSPSVIGNQGDQWIFREIDLTAYAGNIVQLRFRALTGGGFRSDIAIDDIEINEPIPVDLSLTTIVTPSASSCNGSSNEVITIQIENLGSQTQDTIPVAYQVNGGPIVIDTAFFTLAPADNFNHTIQQTFDMSSAGTYVVDSWVDMQNDGDKLNDSITGFTVTTNGLTTSFPDTSNFDNFTTGMPGVFLDGWGNEPNNVFDWFVNSGQTPSGAGAGGTGPMGDTSTLAGTGNYIYYEATNLPQGEEGSFLSGCFDINNLNKPELKFYYHMYGVSMGELHLDLNINGFLIQDIIPAITGDQGDQWLEQTVDLTPYKGNVRLVFRAVRGNGFQSDIAIDQVSIRDAQPVGVDEIANKDNFSIYPNPIADVLVISLEKPAHIEVYSVAGAQLISSDLKEGKEYLNTKNWVSGFYFVTIRGGENSWTRKIVKY